MEQTQIYTDRFFSIALLNGVSPYKNDTQKHTVLVNALALFSLDPNFGFQGRPYKAKD